MAESQLTLRDEPPRNCDFMKPETRSDEPKTPAVVGSGAVVRCCIEVRVSGMNFPHYHQCKRMAVTKDDIGNPVCKQHSPAEKTARREKADAIRLKRLRLHLAYIHAKSAAAPNDRTELSARVTPTARNNPKI